jgi:hypothetical protein
MSNWVATWTDNVAILAEIFVSIPFVTVLIIAPANFELKMRKLYPYEWMAYTPQVPPMWDSPLQMFASYSNEVSKLYTLQRSLVFVTGFFYHYKVTFRCPKL